LLILIESGWRKKKARNLREERAGMGTIDRMAVVSDQWRAECQLSRINEVALENPSM
jgi:hypothetical protein